MKKFEFSTIVKKLGKVKFPKVDLVVGIETGGLVPAALVAHQLGKGLACMGINFRDEANQPRYDHPVAQHFRLSKRVKRVLLVDDVSVTGQTLQIARDMLRPCRVTTFVLKGKADLVLFPRINDCVAWPWKKLRRG